MAHFSYQKKKTYCLKMSGITWKSIVRNFKFKNIDSAHISQNFQILLFPDKKLRIPDLNNLKICLNLTK